MRPSSIATLMLPLGALVAMLPSCVLSFQPHLPAYYSSTAQFVPSASYAPQPKSHHKKKAQQQFYQPQAQYSAPHYNYEQPQHHQPTPQASQLEQLSTLSQNSPSWGGADESSHDGSRVHFHVSGHKGPKSYRFGYDTGKGKARQFRYEERDEHGVTHGRYGYQDKHGKMRVVHYSAHPKQGFQATEVDPKKYSK
ncbi:uncharacterized protein LOC132201051 [Neocloeon triangulifer]|uniref:uncharacterized protein LOC132201051 n=1 Tax=Neocloeon triangulifer TaxID=2078957 RepID=UPI00286FAA4A|nr:uncharacterized protein LOC132201051 [Neocloeon triangulifer]